MQFFDVRCQATSIHKGLVGGVYQISLHVALLGHSWNFVTMAMISIAVTRHQKMMYQLHCQLSQHPVALTTTKSLVGLIFNDLLWLVGGVTIVEATKLKLF